MQVALVQYEGKNSSACALIKRLSFPIYYQGIHTISVKTWSQLPQVNPSISLLAELISNEQFAAVSLPVFKTSSVSNERTRLNRWKASKFGYF